MIYWFWGLSLLIAAAVIYIGLVALTAKYDTDNAPRTDMFSCDKHGLVPIKYAHLIDIGLEHPMSLCPLCFEDRMKEAQRKG